MTDRARHRAGPPFERQTMMKNSVFFMAAGSALSFPLLADEVPDLAARIRYQDRVTGSDGITRESQWQGSGCGSATRCGASGSFPRWRGPITPPTTPTRSQALHPPDGGALGQPWMTAATCNCATPMPGTTSWLRYRPRVWPGGLHPTGTSLRHLVDPALLQGMTPGRGGPEQARWYEKREGRQRTRILWSAAGRSLVVESASLDGCRSYRMGGHPEAPAQSPALAAAGRVPDPGSAGFLRLNPPRSPWAG